jgi:hypothetical protein
MGWNSAVKRAEDFISAYPVNANSPFTRLNATDIDKHADAVGYYANVDQSNRADLNQARNMFVKLLNNTGASPRWYRNKVATASHVAFHIKVVERIKGKPTVWEVQPMDVSASHLTQEFPDRSQKTFINRVVEINSHAQAVDKNMLTKEEARLFNHEINTLTKTAQLHLDMTKLTKQSISRAQARLEKIDPKNRLLLK